MHKLFWGIAALITSIAILIWSVTESFAYPQGPNVGMGSNPIVSFYCSGGNVRLFDGSHTSGNWTIPGTADLIITDAAATSSYNSTLIVDSISILTANGGSSHSFGTGFRIPAGSVISCNNYAASWSGYYAY